MPPRKRGWGRANRPWGTGGRRPGRRLSTSPHPSRSFGYAQDKQRRGIEEKAGVRGRSLYVERCVMMMCSLDLGTAWSSLRPNPAF